MYKYLPDIFKGKLIPKNFGHIGHLTGSKMIDSEDKLISNEEQYKYTVCKRDTKDIVIITEKLDGMNAGVIKKNGSLYPINRKGYDVRIMGEIHQELKILGDGWAQWVDDNYLLYDSILEENEHLAFENCMMIHTLKYKFKSKPIFLLAKYTADNKKINYKSLTDLSKANNIQQPPLLNMGIAIPPKLIIDQYPKGLSGVQGAIEGVVYNYERNGEHESCAKYVSNILIGTSKSDPIYYNKWN